MAHSLHIPTLHRRPSHDVQSATALRSSPLDDRRSRMRKYTIAMSIRTLCVISLVFVQGWWTAVAIAGAVVLPYIAVVIANVHSRPQPAVSVDRPGALLPLPPAALGDERAERPQAS